MVDPWQPRARRRRGARRLRIGRVLGVLVSVALITTAAVLILVHRSHATIAPYCQVTAPSGNFQIELDQAANATTIAAVGKLDGLPDHAVTVALAAALQESELHNLPGGDRDSVGLFQQRPSQGWGTPSELTDPEYAASAFFAALEKVRGWDSLPVTVAAQSVQHSAAPDAYAAWETEARAIAEALTGEAPGGMACQFPLSSATNSGSLAGAMQHDLGSSTFTVSDSAQQWVVASWLVGHASEYGITSISFGTWQWSHQKALWNRTDHTQAQLALTVAGKSGTLESASGV